MKSPARRQHRRCLGRARPRQGRPFQATQRVPPCRARTLPGFNLPAPDAEDEPSRSQLVHPSDELPDALASFKGLDPAQMRSFGVTADALRHLEKTISYDALRAVNHYTPVDAQDISAGASLAYSSPPQMRAGYGGRGSRPTRGKGSAGPPPDLPSLLLDQRVIYIGMPITASVAELIMVEMMWAQYASREEPIQLFFNSQGSQIDRQAIAPDTDAYQILDSMSILTCPVHTVVLTQAENNACMIAANGAKGFRAALPHARLKMAPPRLNREFGATADMMINVNELEVMHKKYLEYMAQGTGHDEAKIDKDCEWDAWFSAQGAVDYGILDQIIKCDNQSTKTLSPEAAARAEERVRQMRADSLRRMAAEKDASREPETA